MLSTLMRIGTSPARGRSGLATLPDMTENQPGPGPSNIGQQASVPSPGNMAGQLSVARQWPLEPPPHQAQVQVQPQQWPVLQQPQQGYVQPQQPYPAPLQQQQPQQWVAPQDPQRGFMLPQQPQQWVAPQAPQRGFMQSQQPYMSQQPQGAYAPAQQWAGQPQQPYFQAPPPQIIINNVANANATAAARGGYGFRKRQSFWIHVLLFLTTVGIGNILYAWYVINWNSKHGF